MSSRRVFLLSVCLAVFVGAQACATDGELNPQPLPPGQSGGDKNGGEGSGDFGGNPASPGASVDAAPADEPDAEAGCPDAGQTLDSDGGEEAGPLVDPDASCGDGG